MVSEGTYPLPEPDIEMVVGLMTLGSVVLAKQTRMRRSTLTDRMYALCRRLDAAGYDSTPIRQAIRRRGRTIPLTQLRGDEVRDAARLIGQEDLRDLQSWARQRSGG